MNGRLISVCIVVESSILAFSQASRTLQNAMLSLARSIPVSFWNCPMTYLVRASSISDPPSWVSPDVDRTSKTPSLKSMMVTSRVPPPRSKTMIFCSTSDLSRPYARAAAVGSLMIRTTSSPAMAPASLVACLWLSLKYAGTVMTALSTVSPMYASASFLIFCSMNAEICWGVYSFPRAVTFSLDPIFLFTFLMVPSGLVTACLLAGSPTSSCPSLVNAT